MSEQLEIAFPEAAGRDDRTIAERFGAFDARHPEVWGLFVRFARQLRAAGRSRYSADAILHRIRWHYAVEADEREPFKINDHFSRCYARKLIAEDPAFAGFFELRKIRTT